MSEQRKNTKLKIIILLVILLFLILVVSRGRNSHEEIDETTALQTEAETTRLVEETTTAFSVSPETEEETEPVKTDLPEKENLVGRIIIEDINLDEYIMQGDEYLEKDNDGNYALQGSIYIPGYSTEECVFINGHTMRDGSMFGNLYKQRDHLLGMKVRLQSESGETEFRIVKTYIVSGTDKNVLAALSAGEYKSYLKEYWDLDVTGKVLSMMCCEYSQKDGRLFVVAEEQ